MARRHPNAFSSRATPRLRRWVHAALVVGWVVALVVGWVVGLVAGAAPARADTATFVWPLSPPHPMLRGFVAPEHAWSPGHRGVDLGAEAGAPVLAAGAGTVSYAGVLAGRGVVTVTHRGGLRTTYEPLVVEVRVGQQVRAGERIGRLALAGGHCLPRACLHWGAIRDGYLDPITLLGGHGPVRLLPYWGSAGWPRPRVADGAPRRSSGSAPAAPDAASPARPRASPAGSSGPGPTGASAVAALTLAAATTTAVAMRRRTR